MHSYRARPRPDQESAWEYPRPPLVQEARHRVEVVFGGETIASSTRALRVLETGHAPAYYIPLEDVRPGVLTPSPRLSYCEFKGEARYFHVTAGGQRADEAAWAYERPAEGYDVLAGHVAFFPRMMDRCLVGDEIASAQPGRFHGGWVTSDVVGPFIGEDGTGGW